MFMRPKTFACLLAVSVAGLIASVVIHETTSLDQWVQDYLYNPQQRTWLIDKNAPGPRFVFYNLPKYTTVGLGVVDMVRGQAHLPPAVSGPTGRGGGRPLLPRWACQRGFRTGRS